jgi:hypothetical protein
MIHSLQWKRHKETNCSLFVENILALKLRSKAKPWVLLEQPVSCLICERGSSWINGLAPYWAAKPCQSDGYTTLNFTLCEKCSLHVPDHNAISHILTHK